MLTAILAQASRCIGAPHTATELEFREESLAPSSSAPTNANALLPEVDADPAGGSLLDALMLPDEEVATRFVIPDDLIVPDPEPWNSSTGSPAATAGAVITTWGNLNSSDLVSI